jgi:thiosulfate reductase cytochrome b subunit
MDTVAERPTRVTKKPLIYRQSLATRVTHWLWAVSLFFLLLSGLQIFNAHPSLYIGKQSGFGFDNAILEIGAENTDDGPEGYTKLFGHRFETTGLLGLFQTERGLDVKAFPGWATLPSYQDLATGRIIHFFFAWVFAATLFAWLVASIVNGHLRRDLAPRGADIRALPRDIAAHLRLRFSHTGRYNTLQKLSYFVVLFILMPLMILTGLSMSPGGNVIFPFLPDVFGGRQTARTIHFTIMVLLIAFFVVHIVMVLAAGPLNELRSIITGWYRADPVDEARQESHGGD